MFDQKFGSPHEIMQEIRMRLTEEGWPVAVLGYLLCLMFNFLEFEFYPFYVMSTL